jgi:hypothetical protein
MGAQFLVPLVLGILLTYAEPAGMLARTLRVPRAIGATL